MIRDVIDELRDMKDLTNSQLKILEYTMYEVQSVGGVRLTNETLCEILDMSVSTINKAYSILQERGWVEIHHAIYSNIREVTMNEIHWERISEYIN